MLNIPSVYEVQRLAIEKRENDLNDHLNTMAKEVYTAAARGDRSAVLSIEKPRSWKEVSTGTFVTKCAETFSLCGYNVEVRDEEKKIYWLVIKW